MVIVTVDVRRHFPVHVVREVAAESTHHAEERGVVDVLAGILEVTLAGQDFLAAAVTVAGVRLSLRLVLVQKRLGERISRVRIGNVGDAGRRGRASEALDVDVGPCVLQERNQRLGVQLGQGLGIGGQDVAKPDERVAGNLVLEVHHRAVALQGTDQGLVIGEIEVVEGLGGGERNVGPVGHELLDREIASRRGCAKARVQHVEIVRTGQIVVDFEGTRVRVRVVVGVRVAALREHDLVMLGVVRRNRDGRLVIRDASDHVGRALGVVALITGEAVVGAHFPAVIVLLEDDVDHTTDGIGAVNGRGAVFQHFDVVDRRGRDHIQVDELVAALALRRVIGHAPAVDEDQGRQALDVHGRTTLGGVGSRRRVFLADAADVRRHFAQKVQRVGTDAALLHDLEIQVCHRDRQRIGGLGNVRTGHHDFFKSLDVRRTRRGRGARLRVNRVSADSVDRQKRHHGN